MEPVETEIKEVKSLAKENRKVVAMCVHDNAIFIATEHEVYRLRGEIWEQLTFRIIE